MKEKPKRDEKKVRGHPTQIIGKKIYFWCPHHNNEQGQDECKNKPTTATEQKEGAEQVNIAAYFNTVDSNKEE